MKIRKNLYTIILLITIFIIICQFSIRKTEFFIDEIYTYGLSNSEYAPFIKDLFHEKLLEQTIDSKIIHDYLSVQNGERFDFQSVYYNQVHDVHPPLHYFLLHFVSSFFPDSYSKWIGLSLNYVFFSIALFYLFRLTEQLTKSKKTSWFVLTLYGLSTAAISNVIFIRMYMLLTLLTIMLAYWISCIVHSPTPKRYYFYVFVTIYLGMMTQYYYVFYAFLVSILILIYLFHTNNPRFAIRYALSALLAIALVLITYPASIDHMFTNKLVSGGSFLENLTNISGYPSRILFFGSSILRSVFVAAIVGLVSMIIFTYRIWKGKVERAIEYSAGTVILLPAILSIFFIAVATPAPSLRYLYHLIPFLTMLAGLVSHHAFAGIEIITKRSSLFGYLLIGVMVLFAFTIKPEYFYPEKNIRSQTIREHQHAACVYLQENYNAALSQDMLQIIMMDNCFVTNNPKSDKLQYYLKQMNKEEVIVFVDTSEYWSSGFNGKEYIEIFCKATEYKDYELLYKFGLSETYLAKK